MAVYQIPQKTQREDKILGPLTIRDMLVAGGTGVVAYFSFTELNRNPLLQFTTEEMLFVSIAVLLVGTIWTFAKIDEKPLEIWVMYALHFLNTPKTMYWEKVGFEDSIFEEEVMKVVSSSDEPVKEVKDMSNKMDVLSQYLDAPEGAFSVDETKDVLGIWHEDTTITAMKEHIEQEKEQKVLEQTKNSPEQTALQSVITNAAGKSGPVEYGSNVLAKPEGGIKGFFSQTTRALTSGFFDIFQSKKDTTNQESSAESAINEKDKMAFQSSVTPTTSTFDASETMNTPLPMEGFAESPDQLLEELRKSLVTNPTATQGTPDGVQQKPVRTTEHVKILSDAELSEQ